MYRIIILVVVFIHCICVTRSFPQNSHRSSDLEPDEDSDESENSTELELKVNKY